MKYIRSTKDYGPAILLPLCLVLAGLLCYYQALLPKWLTLAVGLCLLVLLILSDVKDLLRPAALVVVAFVVYQGLSGIWAMSGKFFLREFSKLFLAVSLFLMVVLWKNFGKGTMQKIMTVMAGVGAIFTLLSVEAATTGLYAKLYAAVTGQRSSMGFEAGTRLTGIFGNANTLSTVLALSIFCSLALLCVAERKQERVLYAVFLAMNAYGMLLCFSMGGLACFAVAVVIYLIAAGKARGSALIRMLEGALLAAIFGFASFPFFNRDGMVKLLPLVLLVLCALAAALLEEKVARPLSGKLAGKQELVLAVLAGVLALAVAFVLVGYNLTGAHTFAQGESLRRSAYPEAGEQMLDIEADGKVSVTVVSQDMSQVMMHTQTVLYKGPAADAVFTVPEGSEVCYFTFTAPAGTTLSEATVAGEAIPLNYTLLPGFIANRLQGLWVNQNAIQRTVFFKDGLKLFARSPVIGGGMGSFETGVTSVQDFHYETRYVHNHYIQLLAESGCIGLILFVGSLLLLAGLLWKRRKCEDEFSWGVPGLWAALVMLVAHGMVELSLSVVTVLCFAFTLFGLIVAICPRATAVPVEEPKPRKGKAKKSATTKKTAKDYVPKVVCLALSAAFLVALCLNMLAAGLTSATVSSLDEFLNRLERAISVDPYESNDYKLSYLYAVLEDPKTERLERANELAAELEQVESNALPRNLTYYYVTTGQYEKAVDMACRAAQYSASDHDSWNEVIKYLWDGLLSKPDAPLKGDQGAALRAKLVAYYELLQQRNSTNMEPVELTALSKQFFSQVLSINRNPDAYDDVAGKQYFHSAISCDADKNGIPDQMRVLSGTMGADGTVILPEGGSLTVEVDASGAVAVWFTVTCERPEDITVAALPERVVQPEAEYGDGTVSFLVVASIQNTQLEAVKITSASAQTLGSVVVSAP